MSCRAHFDHHERIELEEENKERAFQGLDALDKLPDGEPVAAQEHVQTPLEEAAAEQAIKEADPNHITPMDGQGHVVPESDLPNPRYTRGPKPQQGDGIDVLQAAKEARDRPAYGEGPDGYKPPKNKGEKMRLVDSE